MTAFNSDIAFVHVPKCGGHSARPYLREHLTGVKDLTEMYEHPPHLALRDFSKWIGRTPESFDRIYAIVRNPYDHQVSQWRYWRDMYAKGFRGVQFECAATYPDLESWLRQPMSDWHVYDERPQPDGLKRTVASANGYLEFGGYYPYWLAVNGEVPDNVRLIRQETLDADFPKALAEVVGAIHEMPRENVGPKHTDPRPYFSPFAREIVEVKFEWAFEHLYDKWA